MAPSRKQTRQSKGLRRKRGGAQSRIFGQERVTQDQPQTFQPCLIVKGRHVKEEDSQGDSSQIPHQSRVVPDKGPTECATLLGGTGDSFERRIAWGDYFTDSPQAQINEAAKSPDGISDSLRGLLPDTVPRFQIPKIVQPGEAREQNDIAALDSQSLRREDCWNFGNPLFGRGQPTAGPSPKAVDSEYLDSRSEGSVSTERASICTLRIPTEMPFGHIALGEGRDNPAPVESSVESRRAFGGQEGAGASPLNVIWSRKALSKNSQVNRTSRGMHGAALHTASYAHAKWRLERKRRNLVKRLGCVDAALDRLRKAHNRIRVAAEETRCTVASTEAAVDDDSQTLNQWCLRLGDRVGTEQGWRGRSDSLREGADELEVTVTPKSVSEPSELPSSLLDIVEDITQEGGEEIDLSRHRSWSEDDVSLAPKKRMSTFSRLREQRAQRRRSSEDFSWLSLANKFKDLEQQFADLQLRPVPRRRAGFRKSSAPETLYQPLPHEPKQTPPKATKPPSSRRGPKFSPKRCKYYIEHPGKHQAQKEAAKNSKPPRPAVIPRNGHSPPRKGPGVPRGLRIKVSSRGGNSRSPKETVLSPKATLSKRSPLRRGRGQRKSPFQAKRSAPPKSAKMEMVFPVMLG